MNFEPTFEQTMLRDSVRSYCTATSAADDTADANAARRSWANFAQAGWLMAGIPESLGGLGEDPGDLAIIAAELAAGLSLDPFLGCAVVAPRALLVAGGPSAHVANLVERMVSGDAIVAFGGDDDGTPAKDTLRAERTAGGYRLSGRKTMVLGGPIADFFLVAAHLTESDSHASSLFLVPADADGIGRVDYRLIDRSLVADLTFVDVGLDAHALVGSEGGAGPALAAAEAFGILIAAAAAIGASEAVLWQTRDYLKLRKQFGVELASFQALQHRMADMYIALEQAKSILLHGLQNIDAADPHARMRAVSATRIVTAKNTGFIAAQGVQLHGGIGTTEELPVGRHFQHITVLNGLFGSVDDHVRRFGALMQPDDTIRL